MRVGDVLTRTSVLKLYTTATTTASKGGSAWTGGDGGRGQGRTSSADEDDEETRGLSERASDLLGGPELPPAALCIPNALVTLRRAVREWEGADVGAVAGEGRARGSGAIKLGQVRVRRLGRVEPLGRPQERRWKSNAEA